MRLARHAAALAVSICVASCGGSVNGHTDAPPPVIVKVAVGTTATTALGTDGTLWYWGAGNEAPGALWTSSSDVRRPERVTGVGAVVDVSWSTEPAHACVVQKDGTVYCWGAAIGGALGHPASNGSTQSGFGPVAGLSDIVQVGCSPYLSCALSKSGQAYCWGENNTGQLGIGVESNEEPTPQPVHDATDIVQIAVGGSHTCALRRGGAVICWGANDQGQSGSTDVGTDQPSPVTVPLQGKVQQLACDSFNSHAVMTDHSVVTWGAGTATPHVSTTLTETTFVATAPKAPTCVVHTDGSADCFGDNTWGVLGNGTTGGYVPSPVRVQGLTDASQIGVDYYHACALDTAGKVWSWGDNRFGELGDDTATASLTPIAVAW